MLLWLNSATAAATAAAAPPVAAFAAITTAAFFHALFLLLRALHTNCCLQLVVLRWLLLWLGYRCFAATVAVVLNRGVRLA